VRCGVASCMRRATQTRPICPSRHIVVVIAVGRIKTGQTRVLQKLHLYLSNQRARGDLAPSLSSCAPSAPCTYPRSAVHFLAGRSFAIINPTHTVKPCLQGSKENKKKALCSILPLPHVKDENFPASMMPPPETNSKQQHRRVSHTATMIWTTLAALPIMARRERSRSIGALSRIQSEQAAKLGRSTVFVLALWKREGGRERQSKSVKVQSTLDFGPVTCMTHMHMPARHLYPRAPAYSPSHLQPSHHFHHPGPVIPSPFLCIYIY
jgi:hypothetical protein